MSGLSAARYLGSEKIRIIEKGDRPGGLAVTDEVKGFRFDKTGHLLHLQKPELKKWLLKDIFQNRILSIPRISRVWSHEVYTRYPFQSNTYGLPEKIARECLTEYLRIQKKPPQKNIKSFEDFIYHYFGRGFARHFMIPYNKKIWGVHPREMDIAWCEKFVPIPKLEDVLNGAKKNGGKELGYNVDFYYPDLGIGKLSDKIAADVKKNCEIEYGLGLKKINLKNKEAVLSNGETVKYEYLISTAPLKDLLSDITDLPKEIADKKELLRCRSLSYLNIALKIPAQEKFHWCYVPSPKVPFYRVGFYSNFSSRCAPAGQSSLYVELTDRHAGGAAVPDVLKNLEAMEIIRRPSDVLFIDQRKIEYAYVIYDHNYSTVVPVIHNFLNKRNIYSIGRYGAWNYSSMEDALLMGKEAAEKIL